RPPIDTQTDGEGMIDLVAMPDAGAGQLSVELENGTQLVFPLAPRTLDPVDTLSGLQARLQNLGFLDLDSESTEVNGLALSIALGRFQIARGIARTGMLDDATRDALLQMHGS